jgi:predicted AAA+ superfamily ATPase
MNRELINNIIEWKNSSNRKPLILQGARQVGKTWLMKEFGKQEFKQVVYLNFESSERLKNMFVLDFNIERLIAIIEIETNKKIDAANCLLLFDEIQEAPKGITALKYFYEQAPQYFIIAAGSLLGISLQHDSSFPVGKVDFLKLYPMSFLEFLENNGQEKLALVIKNKNWTILQTFHDKLIEQLRLYYFIGGMPEVVLHYIQHKNIAEARSLQQKIIQGYENDFAKYAPNAIVPKIRMVWQSIISQLAKENKKFMYGQLKKGARAKDFEDAINWLVHAGLLLKVNKIQKPTVPLNAYVDVDAFKLFLLDIGLLNALANLDAKILLEKNNILTEYKGALTEQYVCQQLKIKNELYYWTAEKATAEVDFLAQHKNDIIPIEVKAAENLKAKSLKVYVEKYNATKAIRTSMQNYKEESWLTNVPLYAVSVMLEA